MSTYISSKFKFFLQSLSLAVMVLSLVIIQPMQATVHASELNTISGHISDRAGHPISNARYSLVLETDRSKVLFSTDDNGNYSVGVTPGKYYLSYDPSQVSDRFGIAELSTVGFIDASVGNATQNFQYDTVTMNVRFVDQNDVPIPNAWTIVSAVGGETTFPVGRPDILYTSSATVPSDGFTASNGVREVTVLRGFRQDVCAIDPATQIQYCGRFTSINQDVNTVTISVGSPAAPTGLSAQSPVQSAPSLSWSPVTNARSYSVYRDNLEISSTTGTSFVDSNATEGTHSYYVIASSCCNISSSPSNTVSVLYDKTVPVTSSPTLSTSLVLFSANMTMSANATDALSGVAGGEFYIDTDPGQGQGTPMTYSNGKITASKTISNVGLGQHKVYMRTLDKAGNWSAPVYAQFSYIGF